MSYKRVSHNSALWLSFIFLFFVGTFSALANTLPTGIEQVRHLEGITEYRVKANGLTVLLAPDESNSSVTVNMTYLVGSRHENYGQTGMAHLLEHMIFKGTSNIRNALAEFSKRGLQANGTTSDDRTNYYATFAANPQTLDWYIRWQADAMVNSLILREDLDSEMTVVRNEMERNENSPVSMLVQRVKSAAYEWHNYGKAIIGARSDVEGVDIDQLRNFYRIYYQPDNAVLTIAGKFDVAQTLQVIADAFTPIPRPERTLPRQYTNEPVQDGERRVTLRRTGGTPYVAALYHIPAGTHPDYAPIRLATQMLSDTPSGRIYKALVPTGMAASVFGYPWNNMDPGTVLFGAELSADQNPDKALAVLSQNIENVGAEPFTEDELNRAKSQWLNGWNQIYSDMNRVGIRLSDSIALGDWRMFFKQRDLVREATLEQVQQAAQRYFVQANRTEGIYIPTDKPVRAPALSPVDIPALLQGYESDPARSEASAFDSSPGNIDAMTQRKVLNLPSGSIRMALLPKPTRGDRVEAVITARFGDADSLKGKAAVSSMTASMLAYGTTKMSRQEIDDRFNELDTRFSVGGGGTGVSIRLSSRKDTLPDAMALALHLLKEASFPQDQFVEQVNIALTDIKSSMTEPEAVAQDALGRYQNPWPSDDLRYVPTFQESIERIQKLSRDDLAAFHRQFYGNGHMTMAIVGAFEPQAIESVVSAELAQWKRAAPYTRVDDPYTPITPVEMMLETPDKANAFFLATLPIKMQDTDPDYPALVMANYLLGQSHNSRLWMRIRETDGLSYSVGSSFSASSFEPSADWTVYAIYAPENLPRLKTALQEEFGRALKDGFTQEELSAGIEGLLNLRMLSRSRDTSLTSAWMSYLETNRTFNWAQQFDDRLKSLTLQEVNDALRKHIKPGELAQAFAGDFAAGKAQSGTSASTPTTTPAATPAPAQSSVPKAN